MHRLSFLFLLALLAAPLHATAGQAAIASAHPLATEAGFEILEHGGNAFDAAVAVSAALAVVEPAGSGLGGGGFWLLHRAEDGLQIMLDGREMAPGAAHRDMYLDETGEPRRALSLNGALAAAIPGMPAALDHLAGHYGRLPLSITLAPAIRLAREGFDTGEEYQRLAQFRHAVLADDPDSRRIFLDDGAVPEPGYRLRQPELAHTLSLLARHGRDDFYHGDTAARLVKAVREAGGIWTRDDLARYRVIEREPARIHYRGFAITTASLPSAGGIVLASALQQLGHLDWQQYGLNTRRHLLIEALRRAFRDRTRYLGDPDFVFVPGHLTSPAYTRALAASIDPAQASRSEALDIPLPAGRHTSHFSIIDADGNRVAATLSINYPFGSGFTATGTGVLLNDEMDDFASKAGHANAYALQGAAPNTIAPYKRPLSSMAPTFIENDSRLMIIGTPGGSRIITMVLLGLLDFVDGKSAQAIVSAPRLHHQFLPDEVQIEQHGFSQAELALLRLRGHEITQLGRRYGDMQIVVADKAGGRLDAASDPRGEGLAQVRDQPRAAD